jgi:hypothetical protein
MPPAEHLRRERDRLDRATFWLLYHLDCAYPEFEQVCKRVWRLAQQHSLSLRAASEQAPTEVAEAYREEAARVEQAAFFFGALSRYRRHKGIA